MSWFVREIEGLDLATAQRALVGRPGAFVVHDEEKTFLGAFPCEVSSALDPEPALESAAWASPLPRWVGVLPYEAFRQQEWKGKGADLRSAPLLEHCVWQRFPAVASAHPASIRVEGESEDAVRRLQDALTARPPQVHVPSLRWACAPEPADDHVARVEKALGYIASGDVYQVNLARRFEFRVAGHPLELLEALGPLGSAPYAAALCLGEWGIVSGSPELFLDVTVEGKVETRPIKGTRPRGMTPKQDLELRMDLETSAKEQAELTMIVDLERSDLGRVAQIGSVHVSRLPHVVSHPTVHHREAAVTALVSPRVSRSELLRAMMPSGSVSGAPKVRAMQLIAELEPHRRGLYTGALGYLAHNGALRLSMAIRVLVVRGGRAHYFAGGGIVAESDPHAEVLETWWKTRFLRDLLPERSEAEN